MNIRHWKSYKKKNVKKWLQVYLLCLLSLLNTPPNSMAAVIENNGTYLIYQRKMWLDFNFYVIHTNDYINTSIRCRTIDWLIAPIEHQIGISRSDRWRSPPRTTLCSRGDLVGQWTPAGIYYSNHHYHQYKRRRATAFAVRAFVTTALSPTHYPSTDVYTSKSCMT